MMTRTHLKCARKRFYQYFAKENNVLKSLLHIDGNQTALNGKIEVVQGKIPITLTSNKKFRSTLVAFAVYLLTTEDKKTPHKKYLPSHVNVMNMYKQFLKEYEGGMKVKYNYYYGVFVSSFNLGLGSPKIDVCSSCVKTKASLAITQDQSRKKVLLTELLVHRMRAKNCYRSVMPC